MQDNMLPERDEAQHDPAPRAAVTAGRKWNAVSRAQRVRLVVLLAALIIAVLLAVVTKVLGHRASARRRSEAAAAVAGMRKAMLSLDLPTAQARLKQAKDIDPENADADRLAVGLSYALGRLDVAVRLFNTLNAYKLAEEMDAADFDRAAQTLAPLQLPADEVYRSEILPSGVRYLRERGFLWQMARSITHVRPPASTDAEKALLLCRWFALHTMPVESEARPAYPYAALWRGHGSAAELAWAYAELAGQAGLRCKIAVLSSADNNGRTEYLVQVLSADGDALLVDPRRGVPVMDPASGELLSLQSLARHPAAYDSLLALAGVRSPYGASHFRAAQLKTATHPYAFFPRFMVFQHLLGDLPVRPRVAFDFRSLTEGQHVELWEVPVEAVRQPLTSGPVSGELVKARRALGVIGPARQIQLEGLYGQAEAVYNALATQLERTLAEADVAEAIDVLREALEYLAFFRALNLYDAGDAERAEKMLRDYLDRYQAGRWRTLARTVLAETLSNRGETAAAEDLWKDLPAARKLYGALRQKGLLPLAALREPTTAAGRRESAVPTGVPEGATRPQSP